ncbi:mitochondrial import inner membrane translocase subunit TIM50 [Ricinus communis]|uniref:mitochondrial import inner membrane translocase subunit TIM50 n=1 Tax=Ricinus communis TaxID=3988 RepID=UPI00201A4C34|nr:mitochondrial import inner membrane translocase subunit TIM50 [Ricinus communis]
MASIILRSRISSILSKSTKPNRRFFSSNIDKESIISSQSIISDQAADATSASVGQTPAAAAGIGKESIISSQSIISDQAADATSASATETLAAAAAAAEERKGWGFLKFAIIASLAGASGLAGYATYAYTLNEVEEKTKALRESINYKTSEDASSAEKYKDLLYSAAMTVPAKAVQLYLDLRRNIEEQVKGFTEPSSDKLLPDLHPAEQHVFTLVLDLNETIIYSDWRRDRGWRTFKRPGIDDFLQHLARLYEIVVFSDQLNMYVDPVVERLDPNHCIRYRLSRDATKYQDGKHYRDLSKLNRDPAKIIYVSAHALEHTLQPENCVPVKPFTITDPDEEVVDTTLLDLIPFLEYVARASPSDIRKVLESYERKDIAKEFKERSKETQRRMQEQRQQGFFRRR